MGLPEQRIRGIHMAGLIHDIGKIYVPAEIMSRPTRLMELEMMMIGMVQDILRVFRGKTFSWREESWP